MSGFFKAFPSIYWFVSSIYGQTIGIIIVWEGLGISHGRAQPSTANRRSTAEHSRVQPTSRVQPSTDEYSRVQWSTAGYSRLAEHSPPAESTAEHSRGAQLSTAEHSRPPRPQLSTAEHCRARLRATLAFAHQQTWFDTSTSFACTWCILMPKYQHLSPALSFALHAALQHFILAHAQTCFYALNFFNLLCSCASARQQPSSRPASTVIRWLDATTLEWHPLAGRYMKWICSTDLLDGPMNEPGMTKQHFHQCKHKVNEEMFYFQSTIFYLLSNCSTATKRMLGRLSREVSPN